jgi:hypothetical protein
MIKKEIDNYAIECYRNCPKYFYWRILRGLVKPGGVKRAADFGAAIHKALELYYSKGMKEESMADGIVGFAEVFGPVENIEEDDKRTVQRGMEILGKYYERYKGEPFNVLATEVGGAFELDSWIYRTRIDMAVEWQAPKGIYIFDHKTTSDMGRLIAKPSNQMSGYLYNASEMYENVLGLMVNVIGVYKTVKSKDRATGEMKERDIFARIPTQRTPPELEEWKEEVLHTLHQIEESVEKGKFPRHSPEYCGAYRGKCFYLDLCLSDQGTAERLIEVAYAYEPWEAYEKGGDEGDEG